MNKIIPGFLTICIVWVCIRCIPQKEILPTYGSKQFVFYSSSSSYNPTNSINTVTIDGSIVAPVSNYGYSSSCNSSNSAKLTTGTHSYEAYSSDKSMRWTGTFDVSRNSCDYVTIYESSGNSTGIVSTSSGSNVITDGSGLQVYLTWSTSPTSLYPTSYADFDLGISTNFSTYTGYDYSNNSSNFETCQIYSSSSSSVFYVNISRSYINSNYTATCSLKFSGLNNSNNQFTLPLSGTYSYYSSSSYFTVAKVQRSGNSYTVSKYP